MITIQILELSDKVLPTDWCRPLSLNTMSGGMSNKCMYTGQPENNVRWVRVEDIFGPVWFGVTLRDLNKNYTKYEVCRGHIPNDHRLDMWGYSSLAETLQSMNNKIGENDYDDEIPF